jgi:tight adherence protein B
MLLIAVLLFFVAVFILFYLVLGVAFRNKVDIKSRMNAYITTVTADISASGKTIETSKELNPKLNQLRDAFEKVGKQFEKTGYTKRIELQLQKGDVPLHGYEFIFLVILTTMGGAFTFFLINHNLVSMVAAGLLGFIGPVFFLKIRQQKKLHKFNNQIGDTLVLISNSLKAGYGFMQALDMVSKELPPPIRTEFGRVLQDINLGTPTEDALLLMTNRVSSTDLDLVITAMLIQRQIGGNLAEILDNISNTIRERIRIHGEVKTLTAQGRLSGFIIGAMPVALGLILLLINPKYITELFADPRGQLMLIYAAVAEVVAILIIHKIIAIKV